MAAEKRIEPGPLAHQVAESVRRIRESRGLTYAKLAERLIRVGRPIPVLGLSRIEKGDRRVDIDDLVALARALRVPPILLIFPFDQIPEMQILDTKASPWEGAAWFSGRAPFPHWQHRDAMGEASAEVGDGGDLEAFEQGAVAIELWDLHAQQLVDWRKKEFDAELARRRLTRDPDDVDAQEQAQQARRDAERVARNLWETRRRMRQHAVLMPELPEVLQKLDEEKSPLHRAIEQYYQQHLPEPAEEPHGASED